MKNNGAVNEPTVISGFSIGWGSVEGYERSDPSEKRAGGARRQKILTK